MQNHIYEESRGLTIRDLITIGIFSALYFVFNMIGGMPFGINPVLTFYLPMGCALLCGPVYMLLVAKVHKRWCITFLGLLMGLIVFVTGMHWGMVVGSIVMGVLADLVAGAGGYRSIRLDILSYAVFSLGYTGTYVVYFLNRESWIGSMLDGGTEQAYIDTMNASAQPWTLPVILLGTAAVALLSGWLGSLLLRKQFEKAGIVG